MGKIATFLTLLGNMGIEYTVGPPAAEFREAYDAAVRELDDWEGKSYAEIQPSLAECLVRFAEVLGEHPESGNTIWAYTMAACDKLERCREALEAVEWLPDENAPWRRYCHWCSQYEEHAPDCLRQAALARTKEETCP